MKLGKIKKYEKLESSLMFRSDLTTRERRAYKRWQKILDEHDAKWERQVLDIVRQSEATKPKEQTNA